MNRFCLTQQSVRFRGQVSSISHVETHIGSQLPGRDATVTGSRIIHNNIRLRSAALRPSVAP